MRYDKFRLYRCITSIFKETIGATLSVVYIPVLTRYLHGAHGGVVGCDLVSEGSHYLPLFIGLCTVHFACARFVLAMPYMVVMMWMELVLQLSSVRLCNV